MKWYHKVIYQMANAVLPPQVKRMMMGMGRLTVPKNANPWNMFNWLPKKYQTAHNIDLTKLQNYTAEELLELLISVHPDVSHALHTYLRMGDTELTFKADDETAQSTVDTLVDMLNSPLPSPGYQHGRSLDKLDGIQRLMVMVRGACAGEIVLNDQVNDVVDIVPVDPSLIWFKREPDTNRLVPWQYVRFPMMKPGEVWFGQYKRIDTPTFIYEELDPMVDDPYGRTPILPVLQVVFFHLQVLQDLKAVVHNQGYPRMTVNIIEELMLKNMPAQYNKDPNAQRQWLSSRLNDFQQQFQSLNPDDALIGWDSVKFDYVRGGGGPVIDVTKLINVIDTQLATSLKTLLTLLSRHQGSTETYSSVDTQLYIKTVESARNVTRRFWERAFSLAARVKGVQTNIDAEYDPIDLRSEQELEKDRQLKIENVESAESNFYIKPEEAAEEIRKTLGLNPVIPPELKDKLKQKHEQPLTPPQENPAMPPQANRRTKLDAATDAADATTQQGAEEEFITLYTALMNRLKRNMMQAFTIEGVKAAMAITEGIQSQIQRALWQLYRAVFVDSYNKRALASGADRIRNPDVDTSVQLHVQANQVIQGTTQTYHQLMKSAFQQGLDQVKDLPSDQQLAAIKKAMSDWLDENTAYKSAQIALHEALDAYHQGMFAHDEVHAPHTLYDVEPPTTSHEACAEIIANGPYTLSEARSVTLPLHPNCPHHLVPREGGD